MKHLRKFNEDKKEKETESKLDKSIELAKKCIDKCKECLEFCEDKGNIESVKASNECIKTCELYIVSAEKGTDHFEQIKELTHKVVTNTASVSSDEGEGISVEACMDFAEELENLM